MNPKLSIGIIVLAALGTGLAAGVFFAFSSFVMNGLARLPAPQGIAAMQSINIAAVRPMFMAALFGTGALCVALAGMELSSWTARSAWIVAGCCVYLVGAICVTMLCNVPQNNALAAVNPAGDAGTLVWTRYLTIWNAWNHVRTVASAAACSLICMGLFRSCDPS